MCIYNVTELYLDLHIAYRFLKKLQIFSMTAGYLYLICQALSLKQSNRISPEWYPLIYNNNANNTGQKNFVKQIYKIVFVRGPNFSMLHHTSHITNPLLRLTIFYSMVRFILVYSVGKKINTP